MTSAVLQVLNERKLVAPINMTNIVLIPKKKNSKIVADFRLISLCNVLYKLITKTIANRLKKVLPNLISSQQSAFMPGCLIIDNVITAFKTIHLMRLKHNG